MILWAFSALLTAGIVVLLLRPLIRPADTRRDAAGDAADAPMDRPELAVYRDQLDELERDRAQGRLTDSEAEAARAEIGRRMLAAASGRPGSDARGGPARRLAAAVCVLVPAASVGLYLALGSPDVPSQPFAQRDPQEREVLRTAMAEAAELERSLAEDPGNLEGWIELGQRRRALGQYREAADALARAVGMSEGDPLVTATYGEALVEAENGLVTETARQAFERVREAFPGEPRAAYYLALARAQVGDDEGALERWQELLAGSPADAPWVDLVRQRIAEVAERLGRDVAEVTPEPGPAMTGPPGGGSGMSEAERTEMIEGMVEGLAARLEDDPDDLDGWLRLGRSYGVLGRHEQAADAYAKAAALAPDDPTVLADYADALLATAEDGAVPPEFVPLMERTLALDPDNPRALWFLGVQAVRENDPDRATDYWTRLLAALEPGSPEHRAVQRQIESLTEG